MVTTARAALKQAVLVVSKYLGLFLLARRFTRHKVRILCYHGISIDAEHAFRPKLFMNPATFEKRLRYLTEHGFPVLRLEEAINRLRDGTLPHHATVITIDDGWYGTYRQAWPLLSRFRLPATLYVTSYYVVKGNPVFGVAVGYLFWRTTHSAVDLSGLGVPGAGQVLLSDPVARDRAVEQIVEHGERCCDEPGRCALARELAARLGVDYDGIVAGRVLSLMNLQELRDLAAEGLDVQSHTHRHYFPEDETLALRELRDNRAALEPVLALRLEHFCYPSGVWSERHWPWLRATGMKTATTCQSGLNDRDTPVLALRRVVDGEDISQVEFEAEVCGYTEMLRWGRQLWHRLLGRPASESGRVCHGDGTQARGARRRRAFMLPILYSRTTRFRRH